MKKKSSFGSWVCNTHVNVWYECYTRYHSKGFTNMEKSTACEVPADPGGSIDTVWLKKVAEKEAAKYAKDYYKNLVSLVKDFLESKEYEHFEHVNARVLSTRECADVNVDISRSFGIMLQHSNTSEKRENMREILLAYAVHNRSVGYVQGMNFLCALCSEHLSNEGTFWFLNILTRRLPKNFFKKAGMEECLVFQHVVRRYAPDIEQYMGSSFETVLNLFVFQWMLPLFVHAMRPQVTLLSWKHLLSEENHQEKQSSGSSSNTNDVPSQPSTVSHRLHEMALRLLIHYSRDLMGAQKGANTSDAHGDNASDDAMLTSSIKFVRNVRQQVMELDVTNLNHEQYPWNNNNLPTIDKAWFSKIHESYVMKIRRSEINLMQSRKNIVDLKFLNTKRIDNLHYELMKDVSEGASMQDHAKGTKAMLASTLSKTSNVLQFQEIFLKATLSAAENPSTVQKPTDATAEAARSFAIQLFSVLDRGGKSVLQNDELLCACVLVSTLTVEQKLNTCFLIYANFSDNMGYNVVDKEMALKVYTTLLKLSEDWYGIPASMHMARDRVDSGVVRYLFDMEETDALSLVEFKQVMQVHTSLISCIDEPGIFDKNDSEVGSAFDSFLDRVGCTGWTRKDFDSKFDTPNRVRKPPQEYSPSTFSSSETYTGNTISDLDLNNSYVNDKEDKNVNKKDADVTSFNANDEIFSLKKIKSLKGIPNKPRGACSGTKLEQACPVM